MADETIAGFVSGIGGAVLGALITNKLWDAWLRHTRRKSLLAALGVDCLGTIKAFCWTLDELRQLQQHATRFAKDPTVPLAKLLSKDLSMHPPQFDPIAVAVDLKPAEAILLIRYVDRWHGFITTEALYRSAIDAFIAAPESVAASILARRVPDALAQMVEDTLAGLLVSAELFECARSGGAIGENDVKQFPGDLRDIVSSLKDRRLQWAAALPPKR